MVMNNIAALPFPLPAAAGGRFRIVYGLNPCYAMMIMISMAFVNNCELKHNGGRLGRRRAKPAGGGLTGGGRRFIFSS